MRKELNIIQNELLGLWKIAKSSDSKNAELSFESVLNLTSELINIHKKRDVCSSEYEETIPRLISLKKITAIGIRNLRDNGGKNLVKIYKIILTEIKKLQKQCMTEAKKERTKEKMAA